MPARGFALESANGDLPGGTAETDDVPLSREAMLAGETMIPADSIRTVFISDIHLGSKHSRASELLAYLKQVEPRSLYLVGDVIDGWKLKRRFHWQPVYDELLARILEMARHGTRVYYTPGNHDDFLRSWPMVEELQRRHVLEIRDSFVHETGVGERFLVVHGDRFDSIETGAKWICNAADVAYNGLLAANSLLSRVMRWSDLRRYAFSRRIKQQTKRFVKFVSHYESKLMDFAEEQGCVGVICGHVHTPALYERNGIAYCNTGDWIENCSALVEYEDGRLAVEWFFEPDVMLERIPVPDDLACDPSSSSSSSSNSSATYRQLGHGHCPAPAA